MGFGIRISGFFRHSDFEFLISSFRPARLLVPLRLLLAQILLGNRLGQRIHAVGVELLDLLVGAEQVRLALCEFPVRAFVLNPP